MSNVIPLFPKTVFGPTDVKALGDAYDLARETILRLNYNGLDNDSIAEAVLRLAETGVRDSTEICWGALELLGIADRSQIKA